MTSNEPHPPDPEVADRIARRRRATLVLAGFLFVLLGAGWLALLHLGGPTYDPVPDAGDPTDPGGERLSAHTTPERPVPAGAVDVLVVERASGAPVAGVEVALVNDLRDDDALQASTRLTGDDGRARVRGRFPAFLEIRSERWTTDPLRVPVDEKISVRIEVSAHAPFLVHLVDEATGLPIAGWTVGGVDEVGETGARTDGSGIASLSRRRRAPEIVAATDGRRHVRAFLLTAIPGRSDARLEVPAPTRTTMIRCVDDGGRAIAGAVISIGSASSGVSIPCDDRGEATVEYGVRAAVPLVVTAPMRFPRAVHVDGAAEVTVVLLPTATRTFRLRTTSGAVVEEGQRLRGFTRGPLPYGIDGAGFEFVGRATGERVEVAALPAGPFEATISIEGPGVSTITRIAGADDASQPIDVVVGPARRFTLSGIPAGTDGAAPTAVVRVDGVRACATDVLEEARDVTETFARGRPVDPLGTCFVVRGPDAEIEISRSTEPRRVEVLSTGGAFACFVVEPGDVGGARPLAFTETRAATSPTSMTLRVEWADGGAAEMISIDVRRDERNGEVTAALTDSAGTAAVRLPPGRYVVEALGADGARFTGEGPILVPAAGPVTVRLRAIGR